MNQDFEIKNNILIKYHGEGGAVIIPDDVTGIGNYAFENCKSLTSVIIPDSVTSIGNYAFSNCYHLFLVTIGNSVTVIGDYAFSCCISLTSANLPDSVTSIGDSAFSFCRSLICMTIPDSVTSIGASAFVFCESLTCMTIPDSVTSIGKSAFSCCTGLYSIDVSENNAYYISENGVLFDKNKIRLMQYPAGSIRTEYQIPDSVISIENSAFCKCMSLISVTIPDGVMSIGKNAFCGCSALISVIIPDSVSEIGEDAFELCQKLISVKISDNVTNIRDRTFWGCKNLISVTIPDSVTALGEDVFNGCAKLKQTPVIITEGKILYLHKNSHSTCFFNIRQLAEMHDYSVEIEDDIKYDLILQMFILGIDEKGSSEYILKNFISMFFWMIDQENIEIIQKILNSEKFVTDKNIDKLIQYAIDQKKYQIQMILTDYKNQKNWYQNIDEIKHKFKL